MISFAYKKYCKKKLLEDSTGTTESTSDNNPNSCEERPVNRNGGRPKGTTLLQKHHQKQTIIAAKNEIATLYFEEKNRCKEIGEIMPNGWLKQTIERVCKQRGLPNSVKIPLSTI